MPDTFSLFNDVIHWPEGIDEKRFLKEYWQQKPLLIRQAFPDFDTPLPADELAGLALEPDTAGRIITQDDNAAYHLEQGPFDEDRFSTLTDNNWSLLVTDIEKHLPEFKAYLQPFRFIPDWRIDDLMISYAPDGASVGAHVDEYDVFLLQGSGVRTWQIDARTDTIHEMRKDGDLKILANFQASDTWDLNPGDMLYLPPNMAHHGIAKGDDCTTWSVGFRAPRLPDFVSRIAELISDTMATERYTDGALTPSQHGEISDASVHRFKAIWTKATQLSDSDFAQLAGRWLTESDSIATLDDDNGGEDFNKASFNDMDFVKAPFSRFAWIGVSSHQAELFVDGECLSCSIEFARHLCSALSSVEFGTIDCQDNDVTAIQTLISLGSLLVSDD